MSIAARWRSEARRQRRDVYALCLACRDPRVPWHVKVLAAGIVAYAVSPIDLVPDFIPVLGYVDELVLLPLGVLVVRALIPASVMAECREHADAAFRDGKPVSRVGAAIIVSVWLLLAAAGIFLAARLWPTN
jgi:uncharacterized membrane protein YkvA (DUF1232 family)